MQLPEFLQVAESLRPSKSAYRAFFPLFLAACLAASYAILFVLEITGGYVRKSVQQALDLRSILDAPISYNRKLFAFTMSGTFCGVAGSLYSLHYSFVSEHLFSLFTAASLLLAASIGARPFLSGGILG